MPILPAFIAPSVAASALAGLLAFVPHPVVSQVGLAGSMGLAGYSYATGKTRDDKDKRPGKVMTRDREIRNLHQQLSDLQGRIRKADRDRATAIKSEQTAQAANRGLVQKVKALQKTAGNTAASPLIDTCEYTKRVSELAARLAATEARLEETTTALDNERDSFDSRAAKARTEALMTPSRRLELEETVAQLESDKAQIIAAYKAAQSSLEKAGLVYTSELDNLGAAKEAEDNDSLNTIHHWKTQAAQLQQRIQELETEAKKPATFGGTGSADVMGNKVIRFFESKGYTMAAHESDPDIDKGLLISLKAITPIDLATVTKFMGELQVFTQTHSVPKCSYEGRFYRFRLAVNEPFKEAAQTKLTSNLNLLEKAIDLANHIRLVGPSGSGKSVFLDNAIWLGRVLWPDAKLDLYDPKYPLTEWSSLVPTVKGAESVVDAVIDIAKRMNTRLEDAAKIVDGGGDIPEYSKHILAIDEATVALTEARRLDVLERKGEKLPAQFGGSLGSLLRLGRALNFRGYFISQSHLVSKVGLNDGDFDNAVSIFLNRAIDKALNGELKDLHAPEKLSAIKRELERRREQGQQFLGLVSDLLNDELFLFEAPRPGFYHARFVAENPEVISSPESDLPQHPSTEQNPVKASDSKAGSDTRSEGVGEASEAVSPTPPTPSTHARAKCPVCSEGSTKLYEKKPNKQGKYRFVCQNDLCDRGTFRALAE